MQNIIIEKLNDIEQAENITILHAVESGSRAWGFASPDSDYDVRFFYVRPKAYYLRLDRTRDVLEYPLNDLLDINGWDIDKTLKLLHASNPTLFEWSNSPIVYITTDEFKQLLPLIGNYFVAKSGLWHYLTPEVSASSFCESPRTFRSRLKLVSRFLLLSIKTSSATETNLFISAS